MSMHSPQTDFFTGKNVTLLGLGLLGRGVGDAAFLAEHCNKVFVTDNKTADELRVSLDALRDYKNIEFILGGHDIRNFEGVDFIIKAAGVRLDNPYIAHARKKGIPVYMSTALFAQKSSLKTVGVTGTRGKTTVTCMIADILKASGRRVLLGGNIRGVSTLALLPQASQFDVAVLELDSWQLQGFNDLKISPHIAVFTSFYPDHMNYYNGDMDLYLHDKVSIFRHQKPDDVCIMSAEVAALLQKNKIVSPGKSIIAKPLSDSFAMAIPGAHNLLNAGLAQVAAQTYGIDATIVDTTLHNFTGVEGRLQRVGEWQGRVIYNDNNATTQDATLAALKAFPATSIVLIFGGADKGLPIDDMVDYIDANKIRSVLIQGTGSERVLEKVSVPTVATMADAVLKALNLSQPGDNLLFSPAFASFGVFKNEYDRNDQFMAEIKKLTG